MKTSLSSHSWLHSCLPDSDSSVFSTYDGVFIHLVVFVNSPFRLKRRCVPFQLTKQTLFFDQYLGIHTGLSDVFVLSTILIHSFILLLTFIWAKIEFWVYKKSKNVLIFFVSRRKPKTRNYIMNLRNYFKSLHVTLL